MTKLDSIKAIEDRAFAARVTVSHLCDRAGVYHSAWSRAKGRGSIGVDMLLRMESAMATIEREKVA